MPDVDTIVIGGGFYGARLAVRFAQAGERVMLMEKESDILTRASANNQARVHNGYHYPRSLLTALRSHANYARFVDEYKDCIDDTSMIYYGIAKRNSNVTAAQFQSFCRRIGAPLAPAPSKVQKLVNPHYVEAVFAVKECLFDAQKLKNYLKNELELAKVRVYLNTNVEKVMQKESNILAVQVLQGEAPYTFQAHRVFNCTYANLNQLMVNSYLRTIELKHEWTEMALVTAPPELENVGFTLMCGPFFSILPLRSRGLHLLSHVRYTPHKSWHEGKKSAGGPPDLEKKSQAMIMVKDAARYMPCLAHARHRESIWEVKTVLPQSEQDDSRPILYLKNTGLPHFRCVMGGKIDNIYDIFMELEANP